MDEPVDAIATSMDQNDAKMELERFEQYAGKHHVVDAEEVEIENQVIENNLKTEPSFEDLFQQMKEELEQPSHDTESGEDEDDIPVKDRYKEICEKYQTFSLNKCLMEMENQTFDISNLNLGMEAFKPVIESLFFSRSLTHLVLPGNRLGEEGLRYVAYLFASNSKISQLNFANNFVGPHGGEFLNAILSYAYSLEILDISKNNLDDFQVQKFIPALAEAPMLLELDLSHNTLSENITKSLGHCLSGHRCLRVLNLSFNRLRVGTSNIFAGLKTNSSIETLILVSNEIGHECAPDLGKVLENNKTLEHLNLGYNHFTKESMTVITKGLKNNSTLISLNFERNPLLSAGATVLINAVASGENRIQDLNITGVRVNFPFLKAMHNIKSSGRKFHLQFGNHILYKTFNKSDVVLEKQDSSLIQLLNLADSAGMDLKVVLQKIHVKFLTDHRASVAEAAVAAEPPCQDEEAIKKAAIAAMYPRMALAKFASSLVTSPLKVPQQLAENVGNDFADEDHTVDIGEIIALIPFRIDELEFETQIVTNVIANDGKKDKGKKK